MKKETVEDKVKEIITKNLSGEEFDLDKPEIKKSLQTGGY